MKRHHRRFFSSRQLPAVATVQVQFLSRLEACVDRNLADTGLMAASIAMKMSMSKSTLNRRLKAAANVTISNFIKQYRLQRSIAFLRAGYKVKDVSRQVGFNTPSYFAQCFKAYYRTQPSDYHKTMC